MTIADITGLFDYSYWANRKLFETVVQIKPKELAKTIDGSRGCIRNTLVHLINAEALWLARCRKQTTPALLIPDDFTSGQSLADAWKPVETNMRQFLSTLHDADLDQTIEFSIGGKTLTSPIGELLQHTANHAAHHRGQVSLLLRLLGYEPALFDLLLYHAQRRGTPIV
jgi:uncharacterized damage-inducible protein DinB